jgi:hypothetical protein
VVAVPSPKAAAAPTVPHWYSPDDPWLTDRMRQIVDIAAAERLLEPAIEKALAEFLADARTRLVSGVATPVLAAATLPDLAGWPERERSWLAALADYVFTVLRALFSKRYRAELRALSNVPSPEAAAQQYADSVWRQLLVLPEMVFAEVREEIHAAARAGDSPDVVHDRVAALLSINAPSRRQSALIDQLQQTIADPSTPDGVRRQARARLAVQQGKRGTRWFSKVRELARTLAVSVLNAATAVATTIYAKLTGRTRYRQWWTVRDDKVRHAHRRAHGQTQPVGRKFLVGGHHMDFPGDPTAPPDLVVNCRCALLSLSAADGEKARRAYESGRSLTAASNHPEEDGMDTTTVLDRPADDEPPVLAAGLALPPELTQVGWTGVLAPLGTPSGDGRMISAPAGAPNTRTLPLPLLYQEQTGPGHDGASVVGNITRVWTQDGQLCGEGTFDLGDPNAREVVRKISNNYHRWVSVSLSDDNVEMQYWRDGQRIDAMDAALADDPSTVQAVRVFTDWRLMSATLVAEPAFGDAAITIVLPVLDDDDEDAVDPDGDGDDDAPGATPQQDPDDDKQPVTAAGVSTAKRKRAEKNGDAMPGGGYPIENKADLDRAIKAIGRAGGPNGTEADRAKARRWVIKQAKSLGLSDMIPDNWNSDGSLTTPAKHAVLAAGSPAWYQAVADAVPMEPPAEWFEDPKLTGPTKIRVREDGRVYGHIAPWTAEHAAIPGQLPPHASDLSYAKFHRHPVRCADGSRVKTGPLAGAGHADHRERSIWAVQRHYDDPRFVLGDVCVGEDEHGIWCSGSLRYGVTAEQIMFLDRYSISGDWRNGELLAACLASVPGFHLDADDEVAALAASAAGGHELVLAEAVPRMAVEDGEVVTLVAAGVIPPPRTPASAEAGAAVRFDLDAAEEWGRRAGVGLLAGFEQAREDARIEQALVAEAQRDRVAMDATVTELTARLRAPLTAQVDQLRARLARTGGDA